jgi:hypothetical protein
MDLRLDDGQHAGQGTAWILYQQTLQPQRAHEVGWTETDENDKQ